MTELSVGDDSHSNFAKISSWCALSAFVFLILFPIYWTIKTGRNEALFFSYACSLFDGAVINLLFLIFYVAIFVEDYSLSGELTIFELTDVLFSFGGRIGSLPVVFIIFELADVFVSF